MNSNDEAKKLELHAVMTEISKEMDTISESRDQIKDIIDAASATFKIPKPLLRKVSRIFHNKSLSKYQTELSEVKQLYSEISPDT